MEKKEGNRGDRGAEHSAYNQKVGMTLGKGMKFPKFEGGMEEYEEWKELILDWMDTDGEHLEYPCLTIRQSLKGRALEVARRMERETLKSEKGFRELMKPLDGQ